MIFLRWTCHVASILTLFAAIAAAQSQPPPPGLRDSSANAQQKPEDTKTPAEADQRGTYESPIVVRLLPDQKEADQKQQDRESETTNKWWTMTLAALTVLVGFGQLWIVHRQNKIIRGQTAIMREQSQHMADGLTEAKKASDAARRSADIAERAMTITQRAYLHVVDIDFGPRPNDGTPMMLLRLTNTGHLPASMIEWSYTLWIDEELPAYEASDRIWIPQRAVVPPTERRTLEGQFDSVFTREDWAAVLHGTKRIEIYGAIRYGTGIPDLIGETGFAFTYNHNMVRLPETKRFSVTNVAGYNYAK